MGSKTEVDKSYFSADATTGRISSTETTNTIGENGSQILVYEIPVSVQPTQPGGVDTTPWGTP